MRKLFTHCMAACMLTLLLFKAQAQKQIVQQAITNGDKRVVYGQTPEIAESFLLSSKGTVLNNTGSGSNSSSLLTGSNTPTAYSNVTTFRGNVLPNGGCTDVNVGTKLLLDDLTLVGTPPFTIRRLTFSMANINSSLCSARPILSFFLADGAGGAPGTFITAFAFNAITLGANSASTFNFNTGANSFILPSNNVWVGIYIMGGNGATATIDQLNNFGQLEFDPPTIGSSTSTLWLSSNMGSPNHINNPAGGAISYSNTNNNAGFRLDTCVLPTVLPVTGGGDYCAGGAGVPVGLSTSQNGMQYQLALNGNNVGNLVSGTGTALSFGNQTAAGTYTVQALNPAGGCINNMTGSATVVVNNDVSITGQPLSTQDVCITAVPADLSVTATGSGLTYQWYSNPTSANSAGTLFSSATSATFTPPSDVEGTMYYYCVVTSTCGQGISDVAEVIIHSLPVWYADSDHDGFGDPSVTSHACTQPDDYVSNNFDCDDNNYEVIPTLYYADSDSDGYGKMAGVIAVCDGVQPDGYVGSENPFDCNDGDASIYPGAVEIQNNNIDENCNGADDDDGCITDTYYLDVDGDNFQDLASGLTFDCNVPAGYALHNENAFDCNDNDPDINPSTPEILYNQVDENCNGMDDDIYATALHFDGLDDYILVGNNTALQLSSGTIEAWVKTADAGTDFRGIAVKQAAYGIFLRNNQVVVYDWTINQVVASGGNVADNMWHHIAFSFADGVTKGSKLYLDGQLISTFTYNVRDQTDAFAIGSGGSTAFQNFAGSIDEVRIWSRVLCQGEIESRKRCDVTEGENGLQLTYKLNQGSVGINNFVDSTAIDASGNSRNGALQNFALDGTTSNWTKGIIYSNGCSIITSAGITSVTAAADRTCWGKTTTLTANGVTGTNAVVTWWTQSGGTGDSLGTGITLDSVRAGTYYARVTGDCGDPAETSITMSPYPRITSQATVTDATCYKSATGSVRVVASGGVPPYEYKFGINGGYQDSGYFAGRKAGEYRVYIQDSVGCTAQTAVLTIGQPARITTTDTSTNATCYQEKNGTITVTASGGTAPYQYALGGGDYDSSNIFTGLKAGKYKVYIKDTAGCTGQTREILITRPERLSVSAQPISATCNKSNGSVVLTASGGTAPFIYRKIPGGAPQLSDTISSLAAKGHWFSVKDANGCTVSIEAPVLQSLHYLNLSYSSH